MESAKRAHNRLKTYPILVTKCSSSATAYAVCVSRDLDIRKQACEKEFQLFKKCLVDAAKNMKTKL
jgi:hypothetical protein